MNLEAKLNSHIDGLLFYMRRLGISEPETIINYPNPMYRKIRFIGGQRNGQLHTTDAAVTTVSHQYETGKRVSSGSIVSSRPLHYAASALMVPEKKTETYKCTTLGFRTATSQYSETVMLLDTLTEAQGNAILAKLGFLPVVEVSIKQFPIVGSSAVKSIGYDANLSLLEVTLEGSNTYRYEGVGKYTVMDFLLSESKGTFYNTYIKGKYASYPA